MIQSWTSRRNAWGMKLPLFNPDDKYKGSPTDNFKYNGKEYMADLGYYEYGFRIYDPTMARFTSSDPLANKFPDISPFNYAANSPIKNVDIWGLQGAEVRFERQIQYLNSLSSQERLNYQQELMPLVAPLTAAAAAPALLLLAPEAGTTAATLYWSKVSAGALGDAINQGVGILMRDGSFQDHYNLTQTLSQLYQLPGSDVIRPMFSSAFQFHMKGWDPKSVFGEDFSFSQLGYDTVLGYSTNKATSASTKGDNTFGTKLAAESIMNRISDSINYSLDATGNTIDSMIEKMRSLSREYGFSLEVVE